MQMILVVNRLRHVERLYVWANELHGRIPDAICTMGSLTDLVLEDNVFTGPIPPGIGSLHNLTSVTQHQPPFFKIAPKTAI